MNPDLLLGQIVLLLRRAITFGHKSFMLNVTRGFLISNRAKPRALIFRLGATIEKGRNVLPRKAVWLAWLNGCLLWSKRIFLILNNAFKS